jgi:general secretion pathway protein I
MCAERERGFTLLEVLVALSILALALGAMIRAGGESARNIADLRDKTFATWVAENLLSEALLLPDWPEIGETDGREEMGGREWHWEVTVSATGSQGAEGILRRLDVAVAPEDDQKAVAAVLIGHRGKGE